MAFPSRNELARARKKLASSEPARILPPDAPKVDRLKFDLCREFVRFLRVHGTSQRQLAGRLGIDPARMNEIVKYRIDRFTVDRLIDYASRLNPRLRVSLG